MGDIRRDNLTIQNGSNHLIAFLPEDPIKMNGRYDFDMENLGKSDNEEVEKQSSDESSWSSSSESISLSAICERYENELQKRLLAISGLKKLVDVQAERIKLLIASRTRLREKLSNANLNNKKLSQQCCHTAISQNKTQVQNGKTVRTKITCSNSPDQSTLVDSYTYDSADADDGDGSYSNIKRVVSFGPSFEKTDEEVLMTNHEVLNMFYNDNKEVSSLTMKDIHSMSEKSRNSIIEIQEQAEHVSSSIVLDQLQTSKIEITDLNNTLQQRNRQILELQTQVKEKDERIATLELQKDLCKVEADHAKDKYEEIRVTLRTMGNKDNVSFADESIPLPTTSTYESSSRILKDETRSLRDDENSSYTSSGLVTRSVERIHELTLKDKDAFVPVASEEPAPLYIVTSENRGGSAVTKKKKLINFFSKIKRRTETVEDGSFPSPALTTSISEVDIPSVNSSLSSIKFSMKESEGDFISANEYGQTARISKSKQHQRKHTVANLFRKKRGGKSKNLDESLSMKEKLQASQNTIDDLRKRLESAGRQHAAAVQQLQHNIIESKAESDSIISELTEQLRDNKSKESLHKLERKLIQKDLQIKMLVEQNQQTEKQGSSYYKAKPIFVVPQHFQGQEVSLVDEPRFC